MNIDKTSRQMLALCRSAIRGDVFDAEGVDFSDLYSIAYRHGLDGSLYYALRDAVEDKDKLQAFERAHGRLRHRIITCEQELDRLLRLFDKEKVSVMLLLHEQMQYCRPDTLCRAEEQVRLLIDPAALGRAESLLSANGYERISEHKHSRVYLRRPYFVLELLHSPWDESFAEDTYLCTVWDRARLREGCEFIYEMADPDAYIFMLSSAYEKLPHKGVSIGTVLDVGLFHTHFAQATNAPDVRSALARMKLDTFDAVLDVLYRAWIWDGSLTPSQTVLCELIVARGLYVDLENYLRLSTKDKGRLSYVFLPFSKMRVAHPVCQSPLLYPIAAAVRLFWLALRCAGKEGVPPHLNEHGMRDEEHRALWRSVGVVIASR